MGRYRLGEIELDEEARTLTVSGDGVAVQPLVFDFLVYLARHGDRAVAKDELLGALWPGVTVTEASLQRVASLGRRILKGAGQEAALISVQRFGYRLRAEDAGGSPPRHAVDEAALARSAYAGKRWPEAAAAFAAADAAAPLAAADLEQWALAIECTGRPADAIGVLTRAVAGYSASGKRRAAGNPALALARIHLERGELAVAKGWHSRASELIGAERETREYGLYLWTGGRLAIFEAETERALTLANEAYEVGKLVDDPIVESLGLIYRGFFELCLGETGKGLEDQNVAATLGLSSDVDPIIGGIIYCNILWACRNFADWARANQWSANYDRWCRSCGLHDLTGACRLHRAEVLAIQGTIAEAEALVRTAIDMLRHDAPWALGDAHRVLGDIHLAAGDLDKAEAAYQSAYAIGWDPQPGFALLQLERGDGDAANRGLERSLRGRGWPTLQRKGLMLATLAKIAALTGRRERASEIIAELESQPARWPMPSIRALVAEAKAALLAAEGKAAEAIGELETACDFWVNAGCGVSSANVRITLARLLVDEGDLAGAELAAKAVEAVATRLASNRLTRVCGELAATVDAARRRLAG